VFFNRLIILTFLSSIALVGCSSRSNTQLCYSGQIIEFERFNKKQQNINLLVDHKTGYTALDPWNRQIHSYGNSGQLKNSYPVNLFTDERRGMPFRFIPKSETDLLVLLNRVYQPKLAHDSILWQLSMPTGEINHLDWFQAKSSILQTSQVKTPFSLWYLSSPPCWISDRLCYAVYSSDKTLDSIPVLGMYNSESGQHEYLWISDFPESESIQLSESTSDISFIFAPFDGDIILFSLTTSNVYLIDTSFNFVSSLALGGIDFDTETGYPQFLQFGVGNSIILSYNQPPNTFKEAFLIPASTKIIEITRKGKSLASREINQFTNPQEGYIISSGSSLYSYRDQDSSSFQLAEVVLSKTCKPSPSTIDSNGIESFFAELAQVNTRYVLLMPGGQNSCKSCIRGVYEKVQSSEFEISLLAGPYYRDKLTEQQLPVSFLPEISDKLLAKKLSFACLLELNPNKRIKRYQVIKNAYTDDSFASFFQE